MAQIEPEIRLKKTFLHKLTEREGAAGHRCFRVAGTYRTDFDRCAAPCAVRGQPEPVSDRSAVVEGDDDHEGYLFAESIAGV